MIPDQWNPGTTDGIVPGSSMIQTSDPKTVPSDKIQACSRERLRKHSRNMQVRVPCEKLQCMTPASRRIERPDGSAPTAFKSGPRAHTYRGFAGHVPAQLQYAYRLPSAPHGLVARSWGAAIFNDICLVKMSVHARPHARMHAHTHTHTLSEKAVMSGSLAIGVACL